MGKTVALHIEVSDGDVDEIKAAGMKLARAVGARSAQVSTSDGSWDVLQDEAVEAETVDGKKVRVKNSGAFAAFPKTFERVSPDPTPEQIREMRGEKPERASATKAAATKKGATE